LRFQNPLLHLANSISNFLQAVLVKWMKATTLSNRFMNSGENLRRGRFHGGPLYFWSDPVDGMSVGCTKGPSRVHQFRDFAAAQVRGQEDDGLRQVHAGVVAQVRVALSNIPSSNCQSAIGASRFRQKKEKRELELSVWSSTALLA